jgi:hypothetical protein
MAILLNASNASCIRSSDLTTESATFVWHNNGILALRSKSGGEGVDYVMDEKAITRTTNGIASADTHMSQHPNLKNKYPFGI